MVFMGKFDFEDDYQTMSVMDLLALLSYYSFRGLKSLMGTPSLRIKMFHLGDLKAKALVLWRL
jgi:hypothetical protein